MSKKQDEADLGVSLKDMVSILQSGKKLTRSTKNQLKLHASQKQIIQRHSQLSFDSKRSIQIRKDNKKGQKVIKKKQGSAKSIKIQINDFLGLPDIASYIESQKLDVETLSSGSTRFRLAQLQKTNLPNLVRVMLKHHYTPQIFQVKKGELKKQKVTNRQQFLIDLQTKNRSDVRSITKQNGFVLVGENIVLAKICYEEFKQIFAHDLLMAKNQLNRIQKSAQEQLEKIYKSSQKQSEAIHQKSYNQHTQKSIDAKINDQLQSYQKFDHFYQNLIEINNKIQQEEISFVQIKNKNDFSHNQSQSGFEQSHQHHYQQLSQRHQVVEIFKGQIEGQKNYEIQIKEIDMQKSQIMLQKNQMDIQKSQNRIQSQKQSSSCQMKDKQQFHMVTDAELFQKFCYPGLDYILWPALVYESMMGDYEEFTNAIHNKNYFFNEKEHSNLFGTICKSNGLFDTGKQFKSSQKSFKNKDNNFQLSSQQDKFQNPPNQMLRFQQQIQNITNNKHKISQQIQTQINLIVHPLGSNKILKVSSSQLFSWGSFNKQFLNSFIFKSHFQQIAQEISHSIDQLNLFTQQQISQCKTDDIRASIDRLSKCLIQNKILNGIPLRYSNIQKKMLVLVFKSNKDIQNQLIWVNIEQIRPNFSIPQISMKSKFLLYFTNILKHHKNLTQFIKDIYSSYFYYEFSLEDYFPNSLISNNIARDSFNIQRCVECVYPIYKMQYFQCCFCSTYCHKECSKKVINKSLQANLNNIDNLWVCDSCEPCTLCLQPLGNKSINCGKCNNMFHQNCGKLKNQQNTSYKDKYLCQNCIQCKICQKKLKNLDYTLMKGGYQCSKCRQAQKKNQICHICKKQGEGGKWVQCSRKFCGKWIHKNCDNFLQSQTGYFQKNNTQKIYYCPFCRRVQKRKLLLKCIQILTIFDQYQYFIGSDYEDILDYKYVILNPMCFKKMNQRCLEGCYDENTRQNIMKDFQLLIENALKYNMPKDQPHYQAKILNILGQFSLQKLKQQLQCTPQQIIEGGIYHRILQKRKQIFKQIYQRYLEILVNYKSYGSQIEVKKPVKQKSQKIPATFQEPFVFSSRHLLNNIFKSSIIKYKFKKRAPKVQNLFQIQKSIDAYKAPIKQNVCYYHYWNSNVIFYCAICMEYYCCTTVCYKHTFCSANNCGLKGCACEAYQCGCPPLKQKQKKNYEKLIHERFYEKREITQNFKLCLKCSFEKLNSKICSYCQKSYQFFYDFQTCKVCQKIYHKECGDVHASSNLGNFFFKKQKNSPQQQLFSNTLRLDSTCYECSTSLSYKNTMFQKLKKQALIKLIKLQKLHKFEFLIALIYHQNGIKLGINEIFTIILSNYDQFIKMQPLMQQYRYNLPSIRITNKLNKKFQERIQQKIQDKILTQYLKGKELNNTNVIKLKENIKYQVLNPYNISKLIKQACLNDEQRGMLHAKKWGMIVESRRRQFLASLFWVPWRKQQEYRTLKRLKTQTLLKTYENHRLQTKIKVFIQNFKQIPTPYIINQNKKNLMISGLSTSSSPLIGNIRSATHLKQLSSKLSSPQKSHEKQFLALYLGDYPFLFKSLIEIKAQTVYKRATVCRQTQLLETKNYTKRICLLQNPYNTDFYKLGRQCFRYQHYQFQNYSEMDNIFRQHQKEQASKKQGGAKNDGESLILDTPYRNIESKYAKRNQDHIKVNENKQQGGYVKGNRNYSQRIENQALVNVNNSKGVSQNKKLSQNRILTQNQQYNIQLEQQLAEYMKEKNQLEDQEQTGTQLLPMQQKQMKIHINQTNTSKISKFKRLTTIHKIIQKFLLRCFQFNKMAYRRGNTCILNHQPNYWRVIKKSDKSNQNYQISLKRQQNKKWYFSINQNIWIIQSIEQIINKLKCIVQLSNFKQLADFLGFTFKFVTVQKSCHFTKLLRTNPLDNLSAKQKKKLILECYDKYEWHKNGVFKLKKGNQSQSQPKQFYVNKKKIFYLKKINQKNHQQQEQKQSTQNPPYIKFDDLKKDLQDVNILIQKQKNQKIILNQQPGDNVFIAPSSIHKLGLFAKKDYAKHSTMVQYIGEVVSQAMADVRQSKFQFGCYMFGLNRRNVDKREIIDATFRGNMARYLNHSCQPNCKAKIEVVNNNPRIFIYSIRDIKQYEELTYDYQFKIDADEKIVCTCGARNCQGRLN